MLAVLLALFLVVQSEPVAPVQTAPANDYGDVVVCTGVLTVAQGILRRGDERQPQIAEARSRLMARIEARLAAGEIDEAQMIEHLQAATNAATGRFEPELPRCLAMAAETAPPSE